jgi:hypothetical protein
VRWRKPHLLAFPGLDHWTDQAIFSLFAPFKLILQRKPDGFKPERTPRKINL